MKQKLPWFHIALIIKLLTMACEPWPLPMLATAFPSYCTSLSLLLLAFWSLNILYLLSPQSLCTYIPSARNALVLYLYLTVFRSQLSQPLWERPSFTILVKLAPNPCHVLSHYFIHLFQELFTFCSTSVEYKFHVIFLFITVFLVPSTVSGT